MADHVQSKRKCVLVRTSSFTVVNTYVHKNWVAWLLNVATVRIVEDLGSKFANRGEVLCMDVIDWGTTVWPWSMGHQRIQGNIAVHYGLAVQTLFV